ncbi:uncharacterized protein K452DRAFT_289996 [Aplosporella prunicola CBS 121167]|uniref:Uncharacterized protein n=1 Tax=Aplosporella prunicola CBS 121167 TaxID=1176127 RepID=A0A6A6B975_9PEZI|nr:uncharacterized protein K452DRAFT_289996 [Aplosporella prunicola CBS 121167]KAF2139437.1 hypothetical protein K452DRAFT_289996 [Aplosporella prunicola CBS 121167]
MLAPNTAVPNHSVWTGLGRQTFEAHVDELARTNVVAGPRRYSHAEWPKASHETLSFAVERQLADDFAFVAAYEPGPAYVTTAALEIATDPERLTVRLAANEGVNACVERALRDILGHLNTCARKGTSRARCQESILDTIVRLNENKIFGRIGSKYFQRPKNAHGWSGKSLSLHFKRAVDVMIPGRPTPEVSALKDEIDSFHNTFLELEAADKGSNLTVLLKRLLAKAFLITEDGVSLSRRLQALGASVEQSDAKEIRQFSKLASYWRISQSLAYRCRSSPFRGLFQNADLGVLEPYSPLRSVTSKRRRYVHAEIQLLVHYERHAGLARPRAIGSSKEACFLCDAFIKAHGRFVVSKAHRQVYCQWTVPDVKDYSSDTRKRLRSALHAVDRDIVQEMKTVQLRRAQKIHLFRAYPMQSTINLLKDVLPPPTVSTVPTPVPVPDKAPPRDSVMEGDEVTSAFLALPEKPMAEVHVHVVTTPMKPPASPVKAPTIMASRVTLLPDMEQKAAPDEGAPLPDAERKPAPEEVVPLPDTGQKNAAAEEVALRSNTGQNTAPDAATVPLPDVGQKDAPDNSSPADVVPAAASAAPTIDQPRALSEASKSLDEAKQPPSQASESGFSKILPAAPLFASLAGLNIQIHLEEGKRFSSGSASLEPAEQEKPEGECFDVRKLAPGEEKVFERTGGDAQPEVAFAINRGGKTVRVRCRWYP